MINLPVSTPDGTFVAAYSKAGLARLDFPGQARAGSTTGRPEVPAQIQRWHRLTESALRARLNGKPVAALPPIDLTSGTDFQRRVWARLQQIPDGRTRSYGDLAGVLGTPGAARAVGGACGANPVPVLIPCHRVLAANRRLGGFSGGLDWKKKLLQREGVNPENPT